MANAIHLFCWINICVYSLHIVKKELSCMEYLIII